MIMEVGEIMLEVSLLVKIFFHQVLEGVMVAPHRFKSEGCDYLEVFLTETKGGGKWSDFVLCR